MAEQELKVPDIGGFEAVEVIEAFDVPGKVRFLQQLSVLAVPTRHPEASALYVLEAMACGVPVVQPDHGTFPELIEATGGGLLCEPNDP
ncbi:MAG: glycosyltransferase, partial [Halomonas sp.]